MLCAMLAHFLHMIHDQASRNLLPRKVSCECTTRCLCVRELGEKDDDHMSSRTDVLHAGTVYRMLAFVVYCNF